MQSFRELLKNRYKLELTDKEYGNLEYIMSTHNFTPINCSFDAYNDINNLINNIHLMKKINLSRIDTKITIEEVIYSLYPIPFGETDDISIMVPSMMKKSIERSVKPMEIDEDHNLVIIRTLAIQTLNDDGKHSLEVEEHFTFMIYSKKLKIQAGIIFEPIPENTKEE